MLYYLLSPEFQIVNTAGKPCTGYLEVYYHGTRDRYYCASDFDGTLHPFQVPLDSLGGNVVLADDSHAYDVYIYNRYGSLLMSRYNIHPSSGGSMGGVITSSDGSVTVTPTQDGWDLSVEDGKAATFRAAADSLSADGYFSFRKIEGDGDAIYLDNGQIKMDDGWYHFSATVKLTWYGSNVNDTSTVRLYSGATYDVIDFDYSYNHSDTVVLDGDIWIGAHSTHYISFGRNFSLGVTGMRQGMVAELVDCDLHSILGQGVGSTEYFAGNGIDISEEKVISVDTEVVATQMDLEGKQDVLTAGSNITISDNVISATDTTYTAGTGIDITGTTISADTSVVATQNDLAGKQDVLTAGSNITIQNNVISASAAPQVQSNWNESDPTAVSYIQNKPDLSIYATDSELSAGLATKQDTIGDLSDIRSGAALGATSVQDVTVDGVSVVSNGVAAITMSSSTQQQANWAETDTTSVTYIQNKPDLSIYAESADLATVATTGDYDDLLNKPTIPSFDSTQMAAINSGVNSTKVGNYDTHIADTTIHVTSTDKTNWNAKENASNKAQTLDPTSTTEFPSSAATANFVNSSVASATANFLGNYELADLGLNYPATTSQIETALDGYSFSTTPTNNDYVYVEVKNPQTTGIDDEVQRYKFNGTSWLYEYTLNNSSFTAAEKAAIDSGIDSAKVAVYDAHVADSDIHVTTSDKSTWNAKQDAISDLSTIRSGAQAGSTAVQPGDLATVATTGSYNDLTNKPDLSVYAETADLATVATTGSYNDLTNKPTIPAAQVNSDWNASSGVAQILNKPDLSVYATQSDLNGKQDTLTAGSNISISNNVISATDTTYTFVNPLKQASGIVSLDYDTDTLSASTTTQSLVASFESPNTTSTYLSCTDDGTLVYSFANGVPFSSITLHIPGNTFYTQQFLEQGGVDPYVQLGVNSYFNNTRDAIRWKTPLTFTEDQQTGYKYLDEQDVTLTFPISDTTNWTDSTEVQFGSDIYLGFGIIYPGEDISNQLFVVSPDSSVNCYAETTTAGPLTVKDPIPSHTSSDSGKVLGVDSNGDLEWTAGGGAGGADWDATSGEPGYIENKPTPKVLTAGTNISISETASALTISATAAPQVQSDWAESDSTDVSYIQNKPVEKTLAAGSGITLSEANDVVTVASSYTAGEGISISNNVISADETVLWNETTFASNLSGSVTLSETVKNFSKLMVTFVIETSSYSYPTPTTKIFDMEALAALNNYTVTFDTQFIASDNNLICRSSRVTMNGTTFSETMSKQWYSGGVSTMSNPLHIIRVVGIGRVASN